MNKVVFLLGTLLISFVLTAQAIDFSGNWKLNHEKSKLNAQFSMAPKDMIATQSGNRARGGELRPECVCSSQDR